VFTVEYLLRILSCTNDPRYRRPILGRLRWAITPYALIDLLAILPAYLPMVGVDLRSLRAIRLMRVFRILKLGRYSRAIHTLGRALRESAPQIFVCLVGVLVLLVLASTVLYYAERDAQPDGFSSIPAAAWWGVATLTTAGYGDLVPVTPLGKVAGAVVAILGIGIFGLPAGIWASAFVAQFKKERTCPHCGEEF
jgi:voltage-gated potassium channel